MVPWDVPAGSPGAGPDHSMGELTLSWGQNEVSPEDMSWAGEQAQETVAELSDAILWSAEVISGAATQFAGFLQEAEHP